MVTIETIENFLCDLSDSVFSDGIVCDKIYNPEQRENRSAFVNQVLPMQSDQNGITRCTAQLLENREKRSQCVHDVNLIRENFTKIGYKLHDGLAIYIELQYITMPIKIMVDTQVAYTISANFNVKIK